MPAVPRAWRAHARRVDAMCQGRGWAPTKREVHGNGIGRERERKRKEGEFGVQCDGAVC